MKTFKWMCQENFFQKNAKIWWITGFFYYNDSEVIFKEVMMLHLRIWNMRYVARFGAICTIQKTWKTPMDIFVVPLNKKNKIIVFWQKLVHWNCLILSQFQKLEIYSTQAPSCRLVLDGINKRLSGNTDNNILQINGLISIW